MKEASKIAIASNNKKQQLKTAAVKSATVLGAVAMCMASVGFCADTSSIVSALVNQVVGMMKWVGIVVVVIGVAKFSLALKDENPDGQTRAVYYAIAGAVLIGLGPIINGLNLM